MYNKNQQVLAYIISNYGNSSVTSLMKLCYLIDLLNMKKNNAQVTKFKYKRYNYGPFDSQIYDELNQLVTNEVLSEESDYTSRGDEFITYRFQGRDFEFTKITSDEKSIIDEVLESLKGYGAKVLTEIAYKTKPMEKIGATPGGREHLNEVLDLKAK